MVQWTAFKIRCDLWMLAGIVVDRTGVITISFAAQPVGEMFTPIQVLIRATGTLAFLLLTFILCIGPLARLSDRFKPFLYNRRHLGVTTFFIALIHAVLVLLWYHGFSDVNVIVSLFVSNPRYDSVSGFPFESLGAVALIILFVMAATSHDFWNANLGPGVWKTLHMSVYVAFAVLIGHVVLGALQSEKHPAYLALVSAGAALVIGLHLLTGLGSLRPGQRAATDGWLKVAAITAFEEAKAKIVKPSVGEAIAVFKDGLEISAVSNVCRHQGGPLGEGKIVDGCITCPWHGFQYRMRDGRSPEPYTEKIATYATRIIDGVVWVHP